MYPKEYIQYLVHFHCTRDYFECHELLEEYWKQTDKNNKRSILVAFILLSVSAYHHRRENFSGAWRTLKKAKAIFAEKEKEIPAFGIDSKALLQLIEKKLKQIENKKKYESFQLPIADKGLLKKCIEQCNKKGYAWGAESNLSDKQLVHRHKERDRSGVIREREEALKLKQYEKSNRK